MYDISVADANHYISSSQICNRNCIEWDELTEFPEEDYLFMFSRLRMTEDIRKQSNICYRMLSASNPGGRYHDWVKNRFISEEAEEDRKQGILKEVYYKAA